MSPRYFVLLALLTLSAPAAADKLLPGRVLHVLDGDSLILDVRGGQYRVELADIDAPELNQPWGRAARDWLGQALTGRFVVVRSSDVSPDGHIRGRLLFKNQDPGTTLLKAYPELRPLKQADKGTGQTALNRLNQAAGTSQPAVGVLELNLSQASSINWV